MKYDNDGFNMWQIIILMILADLISFAIIGPHWSNPCRIVYVRNLYIISELRARVIFTRALCFILERRKT